MGTMGRSFTLFSRLSRWIWLYQCIATVRAYQHAEIPIADQVQKKVSKPLHSTIPVGQGFFVEVIEDGDIEFNNGQRIFVKESDADGTSNNGSMFFRTSNTEAQGNGIILKKLIHSN